VPLPDHRTRRLGQDADHLVSGRFGAVDGDDGSGRIGTDPFAVPPEDRDPVRRLRGRMPAPVTVWTAVGGDGWAGLTVSSVMVAEGDPASVLGLVGGLTDFWEAATDSGHFVVHLLGSADVRLADRFAQRYPGNPFEGLAVSEGAWGPVLDAVPARACCTLAGATGTGYALLVRGTVDRVGLPAQPGPPLVHHRGGYVTVGPRRPPP
jgi:3-hydroxy-9,10-secoandrosta-1,3,5(10)-triene-9,17-dione monooxygenase reductase component